MKLTINLDFNHCAFNLKNTGCQPTGESMSDLLDSTVNENGVRECCPHCPGCNYRHIPTVQLQQWSSDGFNPFSRMRV